MKIQLHKKNLICAFGVGLLSSCTHYYYAPNQQNIPLFKEKEEVRISGGYGFEGMPGELNQAEAIDLQVAYAFSHKYAAMVNFQYVSGGEGNSRANGQFVEGGFGRYKVLRDGAVFECYTGFGWGSQYHRYSDVLSADLSHIRFFIQPSFGWKFNAIELAFSTRLCDTYFVKVSPQSSYGTPISRYDLDVVDNNRNSILLEPALTLRIGWKSVKLQLQGVYSGNLTHPDLNFYYSFLSAGIIIGISPIKKQKP